MEQQNNETSRKYLSSLLYMLKDLLALILKGGIIGALALNILMFVVFKGQFDLIECLAYVICGGCIGIIIGYVVKCFAGGAVADETGLAMYNMYAGIHNLHILSGSTIGSGLSILGLVFTILRLAFVVIYSLLLIPVSLVYLIIMTVIETLTHGIPYTLGCVLDKLIMIASGIGSIAMIILLIAKI